MSVLLFIFLFINFYSTQSGPIHFPAEKHLNNVKQLTFGGFNIAPRFSQNGRYITFIAGGGVYQSPCLQAYQIDLCRPDEPAFRLSTGFGEYLTSSFYPDNQRVLLTSNFHNYLPFGNKTVEETCRPSFSINNILSGLHTDEKFFAYDLFEVNKFGNIRKRLTSNNRYTEASVSNDGQWIVYLNGKNNTDDNLYLMSSDGKQSYQLTRTRGRKTMVSFSPDNSRVIFNTQLLKPTLCVGKKCAPPKRSIEVFTVNLKDRKVEQLTDLGALNVAPYFHSNNKQFFFSSNYVANSSQSPYFDIYIVDEDGKNLEKITYNDNGIDIFPTFSSNGSKLLWSSSRNSSNSEMNLFIADYVDGSQTNNPLNCPSTRNELPNSSKDQLKRLKQLDQMHFEDEKHLGNVKQLTFGGQNAEAYFSFANDFVVLQAAGEERYGTQCDQIYSLRIDQPVNEDTPLQRLSTGLGTCTCSYWFPDGKTSIHASTFASTTNGDLSNTCPPKKCQSQQAKTDPILKKLCNTSYTWDLHPQYDIYKVNQFGNIIKRLTNVNGYDAEGAISPDGKQIVFTSLRTGDPELFLMDSNGENLRQLTNETGYDGGPFFSPDGTKISFRASRPKPGAELEKYKKLLSYNLVEPLAMELYSINVDGTGLRKITELGGSNWAPFYLDDNRRIVFSTNFNATGHFGAFDLYLINEDGSDLERVTYNEGGFDAFPMMSPNGKQFVWGSSRNGKSRMDLNIFLADWTN